MALQKFLNTVPKNFIDNVQLLISFITDEVLGQQCKEVHEYNLNPQDTRAEQS